MPDVREGPWGQIPPSSSSQMFDMVLADEVEVGVSEGVADVLRVELPVRVHPPQGEEPVHKPFALVGVRDTAGSTTIATLPQRAYALGAHQRFLRPPRRPE